MSNQAENRDRHKTPPKAVRFTEQNKINLQKYQNDLGFNLTDAINGILEKFFLQGFEEKIVDFQVCEHWSAYPSHPEFVKCREKGWLRTIPTEQCIACKLYKNLQIPIMAQSGLEARFKDREAQYHDLLTLIEKLKIEALQLDKTTERGYQNTIEGIQKNWKLTQDTLREITQERDWLRIAKNPIEFDEKLHSDPMSLKQRQPQEIQKLSVEPRMVKRVTEKEKVTEEFGLQQPQESKTPSQLVLCPKTKEMVNFEDVCKTCETVMECPDYCETVMYNRTIGKR